MTKFKKGDLVRVVGNSEGNPHGPHRFNIGDVVKITFFYDDTFVEAENGNISQGALVKDIKSVNTSKPSLTIQIKKVTRKGKPFYTRTMIGANGLKLNDLYTRPSTAKKELDKIIEAIKNDDFEIKIVN